MENSDPEKQARVEKIANQIRIFLAFKHSKNDPMP